MVGVELPLRLARPVPGRVADHHRDHEREVAVQLRGGRPPPDAEEDELGGDDHVGQREEEDDRERAVDLRPRREERDLVAQPEGGEEGEEDADGDRVEDLCDRDDEDEEVSRVHRVQPGREGVLTRRDEQEDRRRQQPRVEADVEPGAGRPPGAGHLLGPGRQPRRPRPQPVEDAADHRLEAQRQRQRAGAEPQHLPEQRPDHRLLEDDRVGLQLGPAAGGEDQQRPPPGVGGDLDDVEEVDRDGGPEPVQRPVLGQRPDPLQVREAPPLGDLEGRRRGIEQAHGRPA